MAYYDKAKGGWVSSTGQVFNGRADAEANERANQGNANQAGATLSPNQQAIQDNIAAGRNPLTGLGVGNNWGNLNSQQSSTYKPGSVNTPVTGAVIGSSPFVSTTKDTPPGTVTLGQKPTPTGGEANNNQQSIEMLYKAYKNLIGTPQADNIAAGVEEKLSGMKPQAIQALPQNYWSNQRQAYTDKLGQEFFGPIGKVQQVASGESAAGRFGSGVGKQVIQEAAINPYATAMTENERDLQNRQMENQFQTAAQNQQQEQAWNQFVGDTIMKVRSDDRAARAEAGKRLDDMILGLMSGNIQMTDQQAQQAIDLINLQLKEQELAMGFTAIPHAVGDPTAYGPDYYAQMPDDYLKYKWQTDSVNQEFWKNLLNQRGVSV